MSTSSSFSSVFTRFIFWSTLAHVAVSRRVDKDIRLSHGYDLATYVTRPDLRAPQFRVTKHLPEQIAPGYWFVAPYGDYVGLPDRLEYIPYQVGPYIYDGDGNLVWSGAEIDNNRNAHDFRTYQVGNETFLSYTLSVTFDPRISNASGMHVMLDNSYNKVHTMPALGGSRSGMNAHEFAIVEDGTKALHFATRDLVFNDTQAANHSLSIFGTNSSVYPGKYQDDCVVQTDIKSGSTEFEWCALDNGIAPYESFDVKNNASQRFPWDYFHANSIDRFADGDYLFSARHVNTLYRVSATDKSIKWRLGGKMSDFKMNFNFSSQHHARILSENRTTVIMTIMDNAADSEGRQNDTALASSAKKFALYLDETPMRAALLQQWTRPDGQLSRKRGNVETLPNGNVFIGWSQDSYMSEHTQDGKLVLEARLTSSRFGTYRSYKLPFIGKPTQPPVMKALQYGARGSGFTNAYVSWNGATEVDTWVFMGIPAGENNWVQIAAVNKTGFETMLTTSGLWDHMSAIAFDVNGNRIGSSDIVTPESSNTAYVARAPVRPGTSLLKQSAALTGSLSFGQLIFGAILCLIFVPVLAIAALTVYRRAQRRGQLSLLLSSGSSSDEESDLPLMYSDSEKRSD